jgi:Glycosyltransferase family 87
MIGRSRFVRFACALLAIAAFVNIAAGVALALREPRRASDLWTMVEWSRAWLMGESLYGGADKFTDYPPNAIVTLSSLALVPHRYVVPLWTLIALALTPTLPWLVVRSASGGHRGRREEALPILLYLCWAAPRTLLQFSLLSMTLACVALLVVDARPAAAGVALGVALFKPHLAGPIALWMLVTGRVRPVVIAAAIVLLGVAVYDLRIGESPLTTAAGWWHALRSTYAGPDALVGHTSLRGWLDSVVADANALDATWIASSLALLIVLCVIARRDPRRPVDSGGLAIPAMFCLWSLLAIYHNGNNMILMLPAFAFLWFRDASQTLVQWLPLAALQAALMFDVPVRLSGLAGNPGWTRMAIDHFDRVMAVATLALVVGLWWRLTAVESEQCPGSLRATHN